MCAGRYYSLFDKQQLHKSLRITQAMAAGLSGHVWSYEEIAALAD
jgi:hypothetical protein